MSMTNLKSFVPGIFWTREGFVIMTARMRQETILAVKISSADLDCSLEKDISRGSRRARISRSSRGPGSSRRTKRALSQRGLHHLEEFEDFAIKAFAEGEADGERFGLGGDGEIGDWFRLDGAGGDGFGEIGGGIGGAEGAMDDVLVGGAAWSAIGEQFQIVVIADANHAGAGFAFAPCTAELAADGGVEGDGFVDVGTDDGDVMETLQHEKLL